MRGPRPAGDRPGRGGRALERLRQWQRARGLPESELTPGKRSEERAEPFASDRDACADTDDDEQAPAREGP